MGIKDILKRKGIQPRDLGHVGAEKATEVMHEASSVEDRVVSNPDPDEHLPKPHEKQEKPIVSVNGEDVDKDRAA